MRGVSFSFAKILVNEMLRSVLVLELGAADWEEVGELGFALST